jgi:hypothetical protein
MAFSHPNATVVAIARKRDRTGCSKRRLHQDPSFIAQTPPSGRVQDVTVAVEAGMLVAVLMYVRDVTGTVGAAGGQTGAIVPPRRRSGTWADMLRSELTLCSMCYTP